MQPFDSARRILFVVLAAVMLCGGIAYFARGAHWAWNGTTLSQYLPHRGDDCDFQGRAQEYSEFAKGIYPNMRFHQPGKPQAKVHTVYPPYALPMFGFFSAIGAFRLRASFCRR